MAVVTKMVDRTRWRTRRVVVRGRTHSHTPRRAGRERGGNTGENMDSHNKALHIISSMSTSYHCLCPGNPSLAFRTQRYLGFLFSLDNNRTGSLPSKAVVKNENTKYNQCRSDCPRTALYRELPFVNHGSSMKYTLNM